MEIERLFQEYKDVCDFVTVYISEAHPKEGWTLGHSQNAELGAKWDVSQPKSTEQRMEVAREWVAHLRELGVGLFVVVVGSGGASLFFRSPTRTVRARITPCTLFTRTAAITVVCPGLAARRRPALRGLIYYCL